MVFSRQSPYLTPVKTLFPTKVTFIGLRVRMWTDLVGGHHTPYCTSQYVDYLVGSFLYFCIFLYTSCISMFSTHEEYFILHLDVEFGKIYFFQVMIRFPLKVA